MKNYLTILLFLFTGSLLQAQVSLIAVNKDNIDRNRIPYSGTRIMMADAVETNGPARMYIFSKNEKGTDKDSLYAEEFLKENDKWILQSKKDFCFPNEILMTWSNRKAFFDSDKDHYPESLFIFSKNAANNIDQQHAVILLLFHKKQFYTIEAKAADSYQKDYFSANFDQLPAPVKDKVLAYWQNLDKED
ncbi:hypothetical protein ACR782_09360 [Sphingobacterium spiritivorum]|uniref:hypothetical protein n=1 Tax=Sphingobacterium spiritivorum TaxID=258 RepID=UPI003DA68DF1